MKDKESAIKNIIIGLNILLFYYLLFMNRNQYLYGMNYLRCIIFMLLNSLFIFIYGILKNNKKTYNFNMINYIFLYLILNQRLYIINMYLINCCFHILMKK